MSRLDAQTLPAASQILPRLLGPAEVARYLGVSRSTFYASLDALTRDGFPPRHPVLKRWDLAAIDAYLDRRGGRAVRESLHDDVDSAFGLVA